QAGAGGVAGALVVSAEDALGDQPGTGTYLAAIGLGALLGGAFGPLAKNPATAAEAGKLASIGQRIMAEGDKMEAALAPIPSNRALVPFVPQPEPQLTRHQFRPSGEAG